MKKCIVSGSFDPITNGHMDIILRAKDIFDEVYVVMLINPEKTYFFTKEQRMNLISSAVHGIAIADFYDGYTVDYCENKGIIYIVRGIRDAASYEYEMRIDAINKQINPNISTIYLPANPDIKDISSTMIKEKLKKGEDISDYVPTCIVDMIGEYYGKNR